MVECSIKFSTLSWLSATCCWLSHISPEVRGGFHPAPHRSRGGADRARHFAPGLCNKKAQPDQWASGVVYVLSFATMVLQLLTPCWDGVPIVGRASMEENEWPANPSQKGGATSFAGGARCSRGPASSPAGRGSGCPANLAGRARDLGPSQTNWVRPPAACSRYPCQPPATSS